MIPHKKNKQFIQKIYFICQRINYKISTVYPGYEWIPSIKYKEEEWCIISKAPMKSVNVRSSAVYDTAPSFQATKLIILIDIDCLRPPLSSWGTFRANPTFNHGRKFTQVSMSCHHMMSFRHVTGLLMSGQCMLQLLPKYKRVDRIARYS